MTLIKNLSSLRDQITIDTRAILDTFHLSDVAAVLWRLEYVAEHVGPGSVASSRIHLVGVDLHSVRDESETGWEKMVIYRTNTNLCKTDKAKKEA
jgi:hypothetical protein